MDKLENVINKLSLITGTKFRDITWLHPNTYDETDYKIIGNENYSIILDSDYNIIDGKQYNYINILHKAFLVYINNIYYVIDRKGNKISKDYDNFYVDRDYTILTVITKNGVPYFGALNEKGEQIVDNIYTCLNSHGDSGFLLATKENSEKWWIDKTGKELLEFNINTYHEDERQLLKEINERR